MSASRVLTNTHKKKREVLSIESSGWPKTRITTRRACIESIHHPVRSRGEGGRNTRVRESRARVLHRLRAWNVSWARSVGSITVASEGGAPRWSLNCADENGKSSVWSVGRQTSHPIFVSPILATVSSLWGRITQKSTDT